MNMTKQFFEVSAGQSGMRLDQFLAQQFPEQTRSFFQKQIRDGNVSINEQSGHLKAGSLLREKDRVSIAFAEPKPLEALPENIPLDILYEDEDLLVINKPKGMVVHPAHGHDSGTLVNALLWHCRDDLSGINGVLRPGIVHRIDQDTTGSLIICKNDKSHNFIAEQLAAHSITRVYEAIVTGNLKEDTGSVDAPIGRHPTDRKKMAVNSHSGKRAVTHYRVLHRFAGPAGVFTHIECRLETGRTHQIRVHMASIGHPLLGDEIYGKGAKSILGIPLQGQVLHARTIGFIHPTTKEYMEFEAPLPGYFMQLLQKLG